MKKILLIVALLAGIMLPSTEVAQATTTLSQNNTSDQPSAEQLKRLGLANAQLTSVRKGIWSVSLNGQRAGYVINSSSYAKKVTGYNGYTPVLVYVNKAGKVEHIYTLPNQETPKFFKMASANLIKWKDASAKKDANMQVDAVSGATYSSNALNKNVQAALAAYNKYCK